MDKKNIKKKIDTFEKENLKVYFKDASDMSEIEHETVALVMTSPPYFNYIEYGKIGVGIEESYHVYLANLEKIFAECFRVLIPNGKIIINITNMKSRQDVEGKSFVYPIVSDIIRMMDKIGMIFYDELIWVKGGANAGALGGKPLFGSYPYPPNPKMLDSIFENIMIFKKDGKLENRATKEIKEESKVSMKDWMEYTKGVWFIANDRSAHPASFPIEIPKRLITLYTFKNEIVLDPFVGTGTTVVAAAMLGRKGIGYEIFESYKKLIKERYDQYVSQMNFLFVASEDKI